MKKLHTNFTLKGNVFALLLMLASGTALAQPVLNSAAAPPLGTKTYGHVITGSITHTAAGAAQTWDYSSVAHDATTFYFMDVAYSGLSQNIKDTFPDGNNASELYYGANKAATIVGKSASSYQVTLGLAYTSSFQKYPVPDTFLIIPMNYQDAFDKRVYDAYGTLTTPFGTYTNTIRIKEDLVADNKFRYLYFQFAPVYRVLMEYKVEKTTQAIDGKNFYDMDYTSVGIEQVTANSDLQFYPNPASAYLNIELPGVQSATISIMNTIGEVVYTQHNISTESHKIDVSNLANGIYLVNVNAENFQETRRVIIQH